MTIGQAVSRLRLSGADGFLLQSNGGYLLISPAPYSLAIQMIFSGSTWTNVTPDWIFPPNTTGKYGIPGTGPKDLVATTGTMKFALDNSPWNSSGCLGYYSPDHTNARSGFDIGTATRLKITYSGSTYYKWRGTIKGIAPDAGQYGERRSQIDCVDWMDKAANYKLDLLPLLASVTSDCAIATILNDMPTPPAASTLATGVDTLAQVLDTDKDENTTALAAFQKIAESGLDYIYVKRDQTGGEVFKYDSRHTRLKISTTTACLNDTMTGLQVMRDQKNIYNRIRATTYPRRVDSASVVLFTLQGDPPGIGIGETKNYWGRFRDPVGAATRISASAVETPVAGTDYEFSSTTGGGGDMNANLGISASVGANAIRYALTNNSAIQTGYLTSLMARGLGIYLYDPVVVEKTDTDSASQHGDLPMTLNLVYQDAPLVGEDFANWLLSRLKDPRSDIKGVRFIANTSDALMKAFLQVEPSDRVEITETATGISDEFNVNGISFNIDANGLITCEWSLVESIDDKFWFIGEAGNSEIGETTTVGF